MTVIEKQMIKNMCNNCAGSLYSSIANSTEVIVNCTVRAIEEDEPVSHVETVVINNGE